MGGDWGLTRPAFGRAAHGFPIPSDFPAASAVGPAPRCRPLRLKRGLNTRLPKGDGRGMNRSAASPRVDVAARGYRRGVRGIGLERPKAARIVDHRRTATGSASPRAPLRKPRRLNCYQKDDISETAQRTTPLPSKSVPFQCRGDLRTASFSSKAMAGSQEAA